eukprot:1161583-Pelagomonas_calceolata.AAC.8
MQGPYRVLRRWAYAGPIQRAEEVGICRAHTGHTWAHTRSSGHVQDMNRMQVLRRCGGSARHGGGCVALECSIADALHTAMLYHVVMLMTHHQHKCIKVILRREKHMSELCLYTAPMEHARAACVFNTCYTARRLSSSCTS